jgi:phage recombination protein Bet
MANTAKNGASDTVPKEKYELAKTLVAKGSSQAEFELLVHMANKYKLDPLLKEIWFIKRRPNDPPLIMTSRDGYLSIAHRSGQFDGMESSTIEDEHGNLIKAVCEVWRKDMTHSFKSEVKYSEYVQPTYIWQKYPSAMLIKVAEVFALKRAFSIAGMITQEEIGYQEIEEPIDAKEESALEKRGQESKEPAKRSKEKTGSSATPELKKKKEVIFTLGTALGLDKDTTRETVEAKYKLHAFEELTEEQANDAIKSLQDKLEDKDVF